MIKLLPDYFNKRDEILIKYFIDKINTDIDSKFDILPETCSVNILKDYAEFFKIGTNGPIESIRNQVIMMFRHGETIGTMGIVEDALKLLLNKKNIFFNLNEWFSCNEKKGTFYIEIYKNKGISREIIEEIFKNIKEYKNIRSVLSRIELKDKVAHKENFIFGTRGQINFEVAEKGAIE